MNNPCKECPYERDKYCDCIEFAKYESYLNGAMEFAEWLENSGYLNWIGEGNDVNSMSAEEALSEWRQEKENE